MEPPTLIPTPSAAHARQFLKKLLALGVNRFELLMVELQEEGGRLLQVVALVVGMAILAFLVAITLTGLLVMVLWAWSPAGAFLSVAGLYAGLIFLLYLRLSALIKGKKMLSATLEQLKKDRECLKQPSL